MNRLSGLYAITDNQLIPAQDFTARVEAVLAGGARIVQYRDKSSPQQQRHEQARQLRQLCQRYAATLIINDDIALAKDCGADGVHLGQDDASIAAARAMLGSTAIIGVSCYNNLSRAHQVIKQGADYVAFGSCFPSATKPTAPRVTLDTLRQARQQCSAPICAIGGIDRSNAATVLTTGVDMLAVISDLFAHGDPQLNAQTLQALFPRE